jgi:hypothetical protein
MDKKTKMYVGAAVLVVAGYMVWKKMQDKKKPATAPKEFAGMDYNTVVGDRKRMVGMMGFNAANKNVQDSGWVRADGSSIAPNFFDVESSGWVRG